MRIVVSEKRLSRIDVHLDEDGDLDDICRDAYVACREAYGDRTKVEVQESGGVATITIGGPVSVFMDDAADIMAERSVARGVPADVTRLVLDKAMTAVDVAGIRMNTRRG